MQRTTDTQSFKDRMRAIHGTLRCAVCAWAPPALLSADSAVHAHHVIPSACGGGNEDENQLLLCPNHHALAHRIGKMVRGRFGKKRWVGAQTPAALVAEIRLLESAPQEWRARHLVVRE